MERKMTVEYKELDRVAMVGTAEMTAALGHNASSAAHCLCGLTALRIYSCRLPTLRSSPRCSSSKHISRYWHLVSTAHKSHLKSGKLPQQVAAPIFPLPVAPLVCTAMGTHTARARPCACDA
jgi:hypothetical protein